MGRLNGLSAWRRAWPILASVALYALAVSSLWQGFVAQADLLGCAEPHAVAYVAITVAGVIAGLALGPSAETAAASLASAFLPGSADPRRARFVRGAAWTVIGVGMAGSLLAVDPAIGSFLDLHRPVLVEADLVLYLMGLLAGVGWALILGTAGWLGLLVTPAMALTLISWGVTGRGWC